MNYKTHNFIDFLRVLRLEKYLKKMKKLGLKIGDNYSFYTKINFGSEPYLIEIGNYVRMSPGVTFVTHDGGTWVLNNLDGKKRDKFKKIIVGNNVHLGMNSVIMPGVVIGDNVIVGCGSIVTKNIPSNSVVAGVPARVIETLDEYKAKNENSFIYTNGLSFNEKKEILK